MPQKFRQSYFPRFRCPIHSLSLSLSSFRVSPINQSADPSDRAETPAWIIVNLHELCFAGFYPLDLTTRPDYAGIEQSYARSSLEHNGGRQSWRQSVRGESRFDHFSWAKRNVSFIFFYRSIRVSLSLERFGKQR